MILQSLYNYYQILLKNPDLDVAPPGFSAARVSYALNISREGEILDLFPLFQQVQRGKKMVEVPRSMIVPEQVKRANVITPYFLCENATYLLGVSDKDESDPDYAQKRHNAFKSLHREKLAGVDDVQARAILAYLENHHPEMVRQHPALVPYLDDLIGKNRTLLFFVEGNSVLENPAIMKTVETTSTAESAPVMQCLVTGEMAPVMRLHPSFKGVRNAQATGASLVSFNDRAYESYNREGEQGLNSPVSEEVAAGYGTALNFLLSDQNPNGKMMLGDTTVVYWAESENPGYATAFSALISPEYAQDLQEQAQNQAQAEADRQITETAVKVAGAKAFDVDQLMRGLDPGVKFFVLGLAPNAGRLAVRFFLFDRFGGFVDNIMQHYADMRIVKEFDNQPDYISPRRIINECVSPKVTKRDSEVASTWGLMSGSLLRSILMNLPYPEQLLIAIINRVRTDDDDGMIKKIGYTRAAIIKAHLTRKYRRRPNHSFQEVLQMSLNPAYAEPPYVLGRLFAVLEKAQAEAIGDVNASIKDRYFASACATPRSVFPVLLRLSQHYVNKAEYGKSIDWRIEELLAKLNVEENPFPAHMTLDEQGIFILGYYHQRKDFFTKKQSADTTPEISE